MWFGERMGLLLYAFERLDWIRADGLDVCLCSVGCGLMFKRPKVSLLTYGGYVNE
jgi:hypothetical protein